MSDAARSPVLVTGAGPVGLTAALMLARHGVRVRIIDRDEGATDLSKALVVWQRTMETLGPILPYERFSSGQCCTVWCSVWATVAQSRFPSPRGTIGPRRAC